MFPDYSGQFIPVVAERERKRERESKKQDNAHA